MEYAPGSFPVYQENFAIDITDNQILIYNEPGSDFAPMPFNGFGFLFGSVVPIAASVDGASGFAPIEIGFSGDSLFLNYSGEIFGEGAGPSIINLCFDRSDTNCSSGPGIPEPATWAVMIAGFGMAGGVLRRRCGVSAAA